MADFYIMGEQGTTAENGVEHKILARYPLSNPTRKWKQDNFVLSQFEAFGNNMRKTVKAMADVGFDMVEIGWATPEQAEAAVALCQQFGLKLIYQNLSRFGGAWDRDPEGKTGNSPFFENVYKNNGYCGGDVARTGVKIDIRPVIAEKKGKVAGYYIWDEPFFDVQMKECCKEIDAVEEMDPTALPFVVLNPSYGPDSNWKINNYASYIERAATIVNPPVLSFDYYPIGTPEQNEKDQLDNSPMWCDMYVVSKTAKAHNMPFWFYYQGENLHNVPFFTFAMTRMCMYAGALYGAKALQHYRARYAIVDPDGNRLPYFDLQKEINGEFRALGDTLMALDCKQVFHDASCLKDFAPMKEWADDIANSMFLVAALPYRTSASEFEDAYGNKYLMVLNRDYVSEKTLTLPLKGKYRVYEVSKDDGLQYIAADSTDKLSVQLAAGDAALFRLQPADEKAFTLEYRLSK